MSIHADWQALKSDRFTTDAAILDWSRRVTDTDLEGDLSWFSGAIDAEVRRPRCAFHAQRAFPLAGRLIVAWKRQGSAAVASHPETTIGDDT